jgi:hypothetical protein
LPGNASATVGVVAVFILSGFCPTTLDLTSGNITIAPLSVLMLGVQMYASWKGPGGASWIIGFSLPCWGAALAVEEQVLGMHIPGHRGHPFQSIVDSHYD